MPYVPIRTFHSSIRSTLVDGNVIGLVLADIPFFAVGLFAFGMFTFLLILKRMNRLVIYLYSSSLIAFCAAIFDLSQILSPERPNVDSSIDSVPVSGLFYAREVGLALSIGIRFLFFWTYVAKRPRGEAGSPRPEDHGKESDLMIYRHSGSWERWGIVGFILKWTLLFMTVAIPILQIMWRIVPQFHLYGPVYIAEATIQIIASSLFILKLMLNAYLSFANPWRILQYYAAAISALLISLSLGIGSLVNFLFSETPLGRFLQAVQLYIMVLFVLVFAFYHTIPESIHNSRDEVGTSFHGLPDNPRESVFHLSPPMVDTPNGILTIGRATSTSDDQNARYPSRLSPLSPWLIPQRLSQLTIGEGNIWSQDRAERGASVPEKTNFKRTVEVPNVRVDVPKQVNRRRAPVALSLKTDIPGVGVLESPQSFTTAATGTPTTIRESTGTQINRSSEVNDIGNRSTSAFPSYYGIQDPEETDSPVYGLDGLIKRTQNNIQPQPGDGRPRSSTISFDELLRQQTELERSIQALHLISPTNRSFILADARKSGSKKRLTNLSGLSRPESNSGQSAFSLSIFPEPPPVDFSSHSPSMRSIQMQDSDQLRRDDGLSNVPPPIDEVDLGAPASATKDVATTAHSQYDVTSFIGDLTGESVSSISPVLFNTFKSGRVLSDIESGPGVLTPLSTATAQAMQPIFINSAMPSSLDPATASSGILTSMNRGSSPIRPFVPTANATGSSTAIPSPTFHVPTRTAFRQWQHGDQDGRDFHRPRITISGPNPLPAEGRNVESSERLRRPSLLLERKLKVLT